MQPQKIFREKLKGTIGRKLLSSPQTYKLARQVFLKRSNFNFDAKRKMTSLALEQAAEAYQGKKPVAWTSAFFPGELFNLFDLVPFAPEVASAMAASLELAPELLRYSEEMGLATDSCSFHRCAAAGTSREYFPLPDFLMASSHLCDGAPRLFQYMARKYSRPLYLLDVPVTKGEEALQYVACQLEDIARDLEKKTGITLHQDKIEEVFENSNLARQYQEEVNRLRQNVPSPMGGEEGLGYVYLSFLGEGHPQSPVIYKTLMEELQERVEKSKKGVEDPGKENFRLIWMHLRPYHGSELMSFVEQELNMKVVMEEMNEVYWPPLDPGKPFTSLARKVLSHFDLGPAERRLQAIEKMVQEFKAHGVVHFSHWGCRQSVGSTLILRKKLREKGIPFLSLDGDCVDASSFPWGQARTRIESFQEVLEQVHE